MVDVIQSEDSGVLKRKKGFSSRSEGEVGELFRLTELSSSFCWARLSSKSCNSVSVRPPTGGGAGRTPPMPVAIGREEVQGCAVIKVMEDMRFVS